MSRRWISYLIFIAFVVSCNGKENLSVIDYTGFDEKSFVVAGLDSDYEQKDTLAFLTIKLPSRLDTFYQWRHYSDCTSCGYSKYRFSDKHYPQYAESGFFYTIHPDSTYQFNIWHRPFREPPDSINLKPLTAQAGNDYLHGYLASITSYADGIEHLSEEFKVINGRAYIITSFRTNFSYLTKKPALFINALTTLKSRELIFIAECSAKDTTGFISNMYKSILSIRISEKN